MFTKEMINDYADKLLIGLSEKEAEVLLEEFDVIKENMELISQIENIKDVEPLSFPYDITIDFLREDEAKQSIDIDDALKNCDAKIDRMIEVPKVVG